MFKSSIATALVLSLAIVSPAMAAKSGQPSINGQALNVGLIGENNTVALGIDATARTRVGAIQNGQFKGNVLNVGLVGENNTVALGIGTEAYTDVGMVYDARLNGDLANIGLIGENNTVALGIDSKATTEVGTIGTER
ncbi:MAG: hypothetical protein ACFB6R_02520 [Alphaproteobacteria bacterium]